MKIILKSEREIEAIREAGRIVAAVLRALGEMARPGTTTGEMCREAEKIMRAWGGEPVFPPETGFPAAICTSVNEEVVHGVPGERELAEGDVVSVDVGVRLEGYVADAAWTYPVGQVGEEARRLLAAGREALEGAVGACRVGAGLEEVARAVERTARRYGFSVVREFVGHGVGRRLHEPPQIQNYTPVTGALARVRWGGDGWTVATADGRLSCHFEHTVAVGADGPRVLTVP